MLVREFMENQTLIKSFLSSYLSEKSKELTHIEYADDITKVLLPFCLKGKLLRGSLFLSSSALFWDKKKEDIVPIAAALELIHTGLLIQDDIIDKDTMRRGQPAIHTLYKKGEGMALCLADICIFLAFEILPQKLYKYVSGTLLKTALGEMQDIQYVFMSGVSKEKIISMYTYKSARYTFALPFVCSAYYSDQSTDWVPSLTELGDKIGLLFQISDDLLGLYGDSQVTGKNAGSDIREKKATMYLSVLEEKLSKEDALFLKNIHKHELSQEDIDQIITLIEKYDIITDVKQIIDEYQGHCFDSINDLTFDDTAKQFLRELVIYICERQK